MKKLIYLLIAAVLLLSAVPVMAENSGKAIMGFFLSTSQFIP